jgi:hypothetical protein
MPKFDVEVTDTFSGEANYCWVHRHVIELTPEEASDHKRRRRLIVRRAKAAEGWSGSRCEVSDVGEMIEIRPRNAALVMFVTYKEDA